MQKYGRKNIFERGKFKLAKSLIFYEFQYGN